MVRPRVLSLGLALITLLLFLPVSQHEFINYDDPDYITENPIVLSGITSDGLRWAFTSFHASNWHPLTWLSHMLDVQLFGLNPGSHHLVSVIFHSANAFLLFWFLYFTTRRPLLSFLIAALFAWHPLRVQSVAWAAERKDVLSAFFWFATLLGYWRYSTHTALLPSTSNSPNPRNGPLAAFFYAFTLLTFILGLMAKPMLVTLPFVLLLVDFWPLQRVKHPTILKHLGGLALEKWPFFLCSFLVAFITWMAQRTEAVVSLERLPLLHRVANACLSYVAYLGKMFWPFELSVLYPLPTQIPWVEAAIAGLFLLAVTVMTWAYRQSKPHLLVGWFWFLGTLVPVIGIVQVGGQAMADRYTYIPLVGIFWAAIWEADYWIRRYRLPSAVPITLLSMLLIAIAALSLREQQYWQNSETLFSRALKVTTNNAVAHSNLGVGYESSGKLKLAMEEYKKAVAINPHLAQAQSNLGGLLSAAGDPEAALPHFEMALRLKPRSWQTHINLATALAKLGRTNEAADHYQKAIMLAPGDPRPHYASARAFTRIGEPAMAVQHFHQALRIDPNHLPSLVHFSRLLASHPLDTIRNGSLALELAERALALTGNADSFVLDTVAIAYAEQDRFPEALMVLRKAIDIELDNGDAAAVQTLRERARLFQESIPFRESTEHWP